MLPQPLAKVIPRLPQGLLYGGDYNPEQWDEATWEEDIELMRRAGVNLVSLAVFSWAKLEPSPEQFEFGWLDRIIERLAAGHISICLATATASPPAWLARLHPESLPETSDGVRLSHGSRQHYCPNSVAYREASARLIRELARRYGRHPSVVLWHINNEIGCHLSTCYCATCEAGFRQWLRDRYRSLDALNAAWGTAFWSQYYAAWEDVSLPRAMPYTHNPAQALDYRRFMSQALTGVLTEEIAAVRDIAPDARVTTNGVLWIKPVDLWECFRHCDVASLDCYPDPANPLDAAHEAAVCHDLYRSFKGGQPFILMEQVTSQVNWRPVNRIKPPGQMRAWSLATVGRGGDGVMFFQWRASRAGAEKFHAAMLPHTGPDSRVFREVCELGADLRRLARVVGARTRARVAMMVSWPNRWALELEAKPTTFAYEGIVHAWHRPLWDAHIAVDMVEPGADLTGYDVLFAPALYQLTQQQADGLRAFVQKGGTLVLGYFSGIVNESEHVWIGGYPGLLLDLVGVTVEEWQPVTDEHPNHVRFRDGFESAVGLLAEVIHARGAEVIATFTEDFFAGGPAITRNKVGRGTAWYIGTQPGPDGLRRVWDELLSHAGVQGLEVSAGPGIQLDLRHGQDDTYLFVVNHHDAEASIDYRDWAGCHDLLTGAPCPADEMMPAYGVRVLTKPSLSKELQ